MKKRYISTFIAILAVVVFVTAAIAAAPPGSGWWSAEVVQNITASSAELVVTAYEPAAGGDTYQTNFFTVGANASKVFMPGDFTGMPSDFSGSAVVSSSADIRATVLVTNRVIGDLGVTGGLAAGQYQGSIVTSPTLMFPVMKNNHAGKTTTYYIQNAGSQNTAVTVTFLVNNVSYAHTYPTIEPNRMISVSPLDAGAPSGTNIGLGSMVATSNPVTPMAGVMLEHKVIENPATILQGTRGFAPTEASPTIYAPVVKNNWYNRFTGLQVQNAGSAVIDITVTYKSTIAACNNIQDTAVDVQPNSSAVFVHLPGMTNLPINCMASAVVEATGNVLGIVNESFTPYYLTVNPTKAQESTAYSAFSAVGITNKIAMPVYKEDSYSKAGAIVLQNVGAADATNVVLKFVGLTGTYLSKPQTILKGQSMVILDVRNYPTTFWNGTPLTVAELGGCLAPSYCGANGVLAVTVTSDQPVVAQVNESTYPFNYPRIKQDKFNYEGFNIIP